MQTIYISLEEIVELKLVDRSGVARTLRFSKQSLEYSPKYDKGRKTRHLNWTEFGDLMMEKGHNRPL
jgi:hypothetical protein